MMVKLDHHVLVNQLGQDSRFFIFALFISLTTANIEINVLFSFLKNSEQVLGS